MNNETKAGITIAGIALVGLLLFKYKCLISEWFNLGLCATSRIVAVDPVGSDYNEEPEELE